MHHGPGPPTPQQLVLTLRVSASTQLIVRPAQVGHAKLATNACIDTASMVNLITHEAAKAANIAINPLPEQHPNIRAANGERVQLIGRTRTTVHVQDDAGTLQSATMELFVLLRPIHSSFDILLGVPALSQLEAHITFRRPSRHGEPITTVLFTDSIAPATSARGRHTADGDDRQPTYDPNFSTNHAAAHRQIYDAFERHKHICLLRGEHIISSIEPVTLRADEGKLEEIRRRNSTKPITYRHADSQFLRQHMATLLNHGIVEPVPADQVQTVPFASRVLLLRKKDGGEPRPVIDLLSNDALLQHHHPSPTPHAALEKLSGCNVFAQLDLASSYSQIRLAHESRRLTSFYAPSPTSGEPTLYWHATLPQGAICSPSHFNSILNKILEPAIAKMPRGVKCSLFVDDLAIGSETAADLATAIDIILATLNEAGLALRVPKCKVGFTRILFLGHIVSAAGLQPNPSAVAAINDMPPPGTLKQGQSVVGMTNYYLRFVPDYAGIMSPVFELLAHAPPGRLNWLPIHQAALRQVLDCLRKAPILRMADFDRDFVLSTDASDIGIGAVLQQPDESGALHPIEFRSRRLSPAELNYSTHDRETLGLVYGLHCFEHYLRGRHAVALVDHAALLNVMRDKKPRQVQHRWLHFIRSFSLDIVHIPGEKNLVADALSRLPRGTTADATHLALLLEAAIDDFGDRLGLDDELAHIDATIGAHTQHLDSSARSLATRLHQELSPSVPPLKAADVVPENSPHPVVEADTLVAPLGIDLAGALQVNINDAQRDDPDIQALKKWLADQTQPLPNLPSFKLTPEQTKRLTLSANGTLQYHDDRRNSERTCVPIAARETLLRANHEGLLGAHRTQQAMVRFLAHHYFWPSMHADCGSWADSCTECIQHKRRSHAPTAPGSTAGPQPWATLSIDAWGPIKSRGATINVLSMLDTFTHLCMLVCVPAIDAATVADTIIDRWICLFGLPRRIIADNGPGFAAQLHHHVMQRLGIQTKHTAAYAPWSNPVERVHATIRPIVAILAKHAELSWPLRMSVAQLAVNTHISESLALSPAHIAFGFQPRLPADLYAEADKYALSEPSKVPATEQLHHHAEQLWEELRRVFHIVADIKLSQAHEAREAFASNAVPITVGDTVYIHRPGSRKLPNGEAHKLASQWLGPATVLDITHETQGHPKLLRVRLPDGSTSTVHAKNTRRLAPRPMLPPPWPTTPTPDTDPEHKATTNPTAEPANRPHADVNDLIAFRHWEAPTTTVIGKVLNATATPTGTELTTHFFGYIDTTTPTLAPLWYHPDNEDKQAVAWTQPKGMKPWVEMVMLSEVTNSKFTLNSNGTPPPAISRLL